MKIGIIGAGFTGLSAAFTLTEKGHHVTIFEKDNNPGGLAIGFQEEKWNWTVEKHYHHWFTNDTSVLELAKKINYPVIIKRPKTCVFLKNTIYQLDSPIKVLTFPLLSIPDRLRMAVVLGFLRYNPFWKTLENYNTTSFLSKTMGKKAYSMIWEPQMKNKFGKYADNISLAWFWARIRKRTADLAYPEKGFLAFANYLTEVIHTKGGEISFNTEVVSISNDNNKISCTIKKNREIKTQYFDKILVTLPSFLFTKITSGLPKGYVDSLHTFEGLGAINLVLRLKKPFFQDGTYWLSVCEKEAPLMAIVEHTNFMNKKNYNNEHLVYLGNCLPKNHPYFSMTKRELLKKYDSFLQKVHHGYEKNIIDTEMFSVPFAQPIIPPLYSKVIPDIQTPLQNIYLANMQQVYPWDRGTNYAVELGNKAVELLLTK